MNFLINLFAQTTFDIDDGGGLDEIRISYFDFKFLPGAQETVFSWLAWLGVMFSIFIIIFWVFLLLRASAQALRSENDTEQLAESYKKIKSLFIGLALAILFPVVLTIIGSIVGLGNFYSWPKALESCQSAEYEFYFQAALNDDEAVC